MRPNNIICRGPTRHVPRFTIFKFMAFLGLLGLAGCGAPSPEDVEAMEEEGVESLGSLEQELSAHESCDTLPPDFIFNGGGRVRTNRTYGRSGCNAGYLLDINNYGASYTEGTRVTYGGARPTTQVACEETQVRVYVWRRNSNGTTTFLGNKFPRGVWLTDAPSGVGRCSVASVLLDRDIPGFVPGGNYRLGLNAQTGASASRREIFIESQRPHVSLTPAQELRALATLLPQMRQTPGPVNATINAFASKDSPGMRMECRVLQLELSAMRVMEPSFRRAGGATATVAARTTTLDALYQEVCVRTDLPPGSSASLNNIESRLIDHIQAVLDLRSQIATAGGVTPEEAAEVMASISQYELRRIHAGCGTQMNEVLSFLENGALPVGMTGPNVLLRSCGGSTSATQDALGLTAGPASIGSTLRACIADAFNGPREPIKDTCSNDPRASGVDAPPHGQADAECRGTMFDGLCILKIANKDDPETRDFLERTSRLQSAFFEAWHNVTLAEQRVAQLVQSAEQDALTGARLGTLSAIANLLGKLLADPDGVSKEDYDFVSSGLGLGGSVVRELAVRQQAEANTITRVEIPALEAKKEKTREEMCKADPNHPFCNESADPRERCAEWDLASGPVWFDLGTTQRPMTMSDRIEQCTCEAIDAISGPITGGANLVCGSEAERRKHQCYGDLRTKPNPETCWDFFQPAEVDRDALRIDMCTKILCESGKTPLVVNGVCTCLDTPPTSADLVSRCGFTGPAGALTCDAGSGLVCDALGARCVGFDAGRAPIGTPGCRTPNGTPVGGRGEWGVLNASDIYIATFPNRPSLGGEDYLMMRPGFVSMDGPDKELAEYASVGDVWDLQVLPPDVLPTGDRGSVQLLCSNPGAGVFNAFCSQREFTNLVAGQANRVGLPLNDCLDSCVRAGSTPFTFGYGFRTPVGQTQRSGFGGGVWSGVLQPVTNPFPVCDPTPDPSPPSDPRLTRDLLQAGTIRAGSIEGLFTTTWNFPQQSGTASGVTPFLIR